MNSTNDWLADCGRFTDRDWQIDTYWIHQCYQTVPVSIQNDCSYRYFKISIVHWQNRTMPLSVPANSVNGLLSGASPPARWCFEDSIVNNAQSGGTKLTRIDEIALNVPNVTCWILSKHRQWKWFRATWTCIRNCSIECKGSSSIACMKR